MTLVKVFKQQFQMMRDNGWSSLLDRVSYFCERHNIDIPSMNDTFLTRGRPRREAHEITNFHHYQVELFYVVIDIQLQELNSRFTEVNTELLLCVACLNPCDSFIAFDKQKLLRLAQFYPQEFSPIELMILNDQLGTYIIDMLSRSEFFELKGISDLAQKMVETKKTYCVSACLFACYIGFGPTCCYCNCGDNIFCYEYCEKSTAKSDGRSMDE